jgi:arylsulfatase A-like enzyme
MPRAVLFLAAVIAAHAATAQGTNVLVVIADDLGHRQIGHFGGELVTPGLDRLFRDGVELTNFYTWPVCQPTRCAFFTGQYPERFGIGTKLGFSDLPDDAATLAEAFRDNGYDTSLIGKWQLGGDAGHPLQQGFRAYTGALDKPEGHYTDHWEINGQPFGASQYEPEAIAQHGTSFIASQGAEPWFLVAAFNAVHAPPVAPTPYKQRVPRTIHGDDRTYAAMVLALDDAVQALTDAAPADTLIVFFSDNGPALRYGRSLYRGGKHDLFEGGVHVPACIYWKGRTPDAPVYDGLFQVTDLYSTLLRLCGFDGGPASSADHSSLLPYSELPQELRAWFPSLDWPLRGGRAMRLELLPPRSGVYLSRAEFQRTVIRSGRWKLFNFQGRQELYDVHADPRERHDLAGLRNKRNVVRRLSRELDGWIDEVSEP